MPHSLTQKIPGFLLPYVVEQNYDLYTPIDHAGWRLILRLSQEFFKSTAHQKYLDGLQLTGISIDRIPRISEMDEKLKKFGWRAVAVSGFLPPAVFMEFQALGILPIACDMRSLEHLEYTPAPDIVHEAAGHAPILADPQYAQYLRSYGEISRRAIYSDQDMNVYHAIRELSIAKEDPKSTPIEIEKAQKNLEKALSQVTYVSEATLLSRMGWWTFEYGLMGTLDDPKIYGAGLLSSLSESQHCLDAEVKKIPFSVFCIQTGYDITRPQPQLFVAKSFSELEEGLIELSSLMSFKQGGLKSLKKAIAAQTVTTLQLETQIQVSGKITEVWFKTQDKKAIRLNSEHISLNEIDPFAPEVKNLAEASFEPFFIRAAGPVQLSLSDQQIQDQGPRVHASGFSSPLGMAHSPFDSRVLPLSDFSQKEMEEVKKRGRLRMESGIEITGKLASTIQHGGKYVLLTWHEVTVQLLSGDHPPELLFDPAWGSYDMICGMHVISVFGGAADRAQYILETGGFQQTPGSQKTNLTPQNAELNSIYLKMRKLRESDFGTSEKSNHPKTPTSISFLNGIESILREIQNYPAEWLIRLEAMEWMSQWTRILRSTHPQWVDKIETHLRKLNQELLQAVRLAPSDVKGSKFLPELIRRSVDALAIASPSDLQSQPLPPTLGEPR